MNNSVFLFDSVILKPAIEFRRGEAVVMGENCQVDGVAVGQSGLGKVVVIKGKGLDPDIVSMVKNHESARLGMVIGASPFK